MKSYYYWIQERQTEDPVSYADNAYNDLIEVMLGDEEFPKEATDFDSLYNSLCCECFFRGISFSRALEGEFIESYLEYMGYKDIETLRMRGE